MNQDLRRMAEEELLEFDCVSIAGKKFVAVEDAGRVCREAIAAALVKLTQGQEVVLTSNYGRIVKVEVAGATHFEVDLSPRSYFEVCWAYGWSGTYSSREEAEEECESLCGYRRAIREVKPTDAAYKNPSHLNLKEQRIPIHPIPSQQEERVRELEKALDVADRALKSKRSYMDAESVWHDTWDEEIVNLAVASIAAARNKEQEK